jgi:hypothetical protein
MGEDANGRRGLDWGELRQLKAVAEAATEKRRPTRDEGESLLAEVAPSLDTVPEVHWEAPLAKVKPLKSGGEAEFRLQPLLRPLKLRFLIDEQDKFETWSQLSPNQPVKFAGKFESVKPREIVLRVRIDTTPAEEVVPVDGAAESY